MSKIITLGLYIPLFSRSFFQIILSCMVSIQEQFIIKSGLGWRAYGMSHDCHRLYLTLQISLTLLQPLTRQRRENESSCEVFCTCAKCVGYQRPSRRDQGSASHERMRANIYKSNIRTDFCNKNLQTVGA